MKNKNQTGQVLIILLLVTMVALTIGLAITQRSISDISISTRTEQSSRAFSAAEAGIESALESGADPTTPITFDENQSSATVTPVDSLPRPTQALEYFKISKADFAHFWLASPIDLSKFYDRTTVAVYFGNTNQDPDYASSDTPPAIEVNVITKKADGSYGSKRTYFDSDSSRASSNNFQMANCLSNTQAYTTLSKSSAVADRRSFRCAATADTGIGTPILARVRVLYANKNQPVAVASCNTTNPTNYTDCDLPPQAELYTSVGSSGQTVRKVQVLKVTDVVPFYFDYAIFSEGKIEKN